MKYVTKILLFLFVPTIAVAVLAAVFGFDSTGEFVQATIEEILPFGNVVSVVIGKYAPITVGKPYSFYLLMIDVMKMLITSCLFTFTVRLASILTGIDDKKRVLFPIVQCIVSVFLAALAGFMIEKLQTLLEEKFGNVLSVLSILLIAALVVAIWVAFMHARGGFAFNLIFSYLIARKLIPSVIINTATYIFLSVMLICLTNDELSSAVMPIALMIYGMAILVSTLFEKHIPIGN